MMISVKYIGFYKIKNLLKVFYIPSNFCKINGIKAFEKNTFYSTLERINIKHNQGSHNNNYYTIDYEKLNEIAIKNKWLCEYDEYDDTHSVPFTHSVEEENVFTTIEEIERLEKRANMLREKLLNKN